jgi:hypothetical protein
MAVPVGHRRWMPSAPGAGHVSILTVHEEDSVEEGFHGSPSDIGQHHIPKHPDRRAVSTRSAVHISPSARGVPRETRTRDPAPHTPTRACARPAPACGTELINSGRKPLRNDGSYVARNQVSILDTSDTPGSLEVTAVPKRNSDSPLAQMRGVTLYALIGHPA